MKYFTIPHLKIFKTIVFIIPLGILVWIADQNYAFTGAVKYHYRPGPTQLSRAINLDTTDDLVALADVDRRLHWYQADDALQFNIRPLRGFDIATVKLKIKNISQPRIDFSAQGTTQSSSIKAVIRNQLLDELAWPALVEDGLTLWQRPNEENATNPHTIYQTRAEFLANKPNPTQLGVIGMDPGQFVTLPEYQPRTKLQTIGPSLRGSHTLYMYVENEPLNLSLTKQDLNSKAGEDVATIVIHSSNDLIYSQTIKDDGDISLYGHSGEQQHYNISLPDLPRGLYQVGLISSEDVLFREISTSQRYVYFVGSLFLAAGPSYPPGTPFSTALVRAESRRLDFETPHDSAVNQEIQLLISEKSKSDMVAILARKFTYTRRDLSGLTTITIPKPDMYVRGDTFVFPGFDFLPDETIPKTNEQVEKGIFSFNYIISPYQPQETFGEIVIDKQYAVDGLLMSDGLLHFSLQSPGLAEKRNKVEIQSIDVELFGKSLTADILLEKIRNFIKTIVP